MGLKELKVNCVVPFQTDAHAVTQAGATVSARDSSVRERASAKAFDTDSMYTGLIETLLRLQV